MAKKSFIKNAVKVVTDFTDKNSPAILTGLGVAGLVTTVVMAVRATPKVNEILEREEAKGSSNVEKLKAVAPVVVPTVVMGAATATCIIGSNVQSSRKIAALSAAYSIAEASSREWVEKTKEVVGDKAMEKIHDAICEDKVNQNPPIGGTNTSSDGTEVIITNHGNTLCFDAFTSRYFRSNPEYIRKIINDMNLKMYNENYVTMNELYSELGLDRCKMGENFGWNIENGQIEGWFSSMLTDSNEPVLIIDFNSGPIWLHK